jgi:hypothetical protein
LFLITVEDDSREAVIINDKDDSFPLAELCCCLFKDVILQKLQQQKKSAFSMPLLFLPEQKFCPREVLQTKIFNFKILRFFPF